MINELKKYLLFFCFLLIVMDFLITIDKNPENKLANNFFIFGIFNICWLLFSFLFVLYFYFQEKNYLKKQEQVRKEVELKEIEKEHLRKKEHEEWLKGEPERRRKAEEDKKIWEEQQRVLKIRLDNEQKEEELKLLKIQREKEEREAELLRIKIQEENARKVAYEKQEKERVYAEERKKQEKEAQRIAKEQDIKREQEEKNKRDAEENIRNQKRKEFKKVLQQDINTLQVSWRDYSDTLGVKMNTLTYSFPPTLTEFDRSVLMRKLAEEYTVMKDILRKSEPYLVESLKRPQEYLKEKIYIYETLSQWHTQFLNELCHINKLQITNAQERLHRKKEAEEDYNYRRNTHCEELHTFPTTLIYDDLREDIGFAINKDEEYMD